MIDDRCYNSGKLLEANKNISFEIAHKPKNWVI